MLYDKLIIQIMQIDTDEKLLKYKIACNCKDFAINVVIVIVISSPLLLRPWAYSYYQKVHKCKVLITKNI